MEAIMITISSLSSIKMSISAHKWDHIIKKKTELAVVFLHSCNVQWLLWPPCQHPVTYGSNTFARACVATLIPHGVAEFGQEGQQLSLQANWCETEALQQGLGLHAVSVVLYSNTTRIYLQPLLVLHRNLKKTQEYRGKTTFITTFNIVMFLEKSKNSIHVA